MRSEPPHLVLGETCVYVCIAEPLAKNSLQEQLCLPMGLHSLKLRSTKKVTNPMYSKHDFVNLGETCWWERVRMQQECKPITCLATCKMSPGVQKRLVTKVMWLPSTFVPYVICERCGDMYCWPKTISLESSETESTVSM